MRDLGWPFWLAAVAAAFIGAGFSFIFAPGLAKAPIFIMVIATIGLLLIIISVIRNLGFLGGEMGFGNIPLVKHMPIKTIVIVAVMGIFIHRIDHSRIGRAMGLVNVNQDVAQTLGVSLFWMSVWLQVISGGIGGIAGALYAGTMPMLHINAFGFEVLLLVVIFLVIGGSSTLWGPLFFTPLLYGIAIFLPSFIAGWRYIIYGIVLIGVLSLRPQGVIDKPMLKKLNRKSAQLMKLIFKKETMQH
jgi:branched-chain amino acid transport system permease protein